MQRHLHLLLHLLLVVRRRGRGAVLPVRTLRRALVVKGIVLHVHPITVNAPISSPRFTVHFKIGSLPAQVRVGSLLCVVGASARTQFVNVGECPRRVFLRPRGGVARSQAQNQITMRPHAWPGAGLCDEWTIRWRLCTPVWLSYRLQRRISGLGAPVEPPCASHMLRLMGSRLRVGMVMGMVMGSVYLRVVVVQVAMLHHHLPPKPPQVTQLSPPMSEWMGACAALSTCHSEPASSRGESQPKP